MRTIVRTLFRRFKRRPREPRHRALIGVLTDAGARFGDRGDAAIDLSGSDEPEAEAALLEVARDPASDLELTEDCGLSLAEIWSRKRRLDVPLAATLPPPALRIALSVLRDRRPEWLDALHALMRRTGEPARGATESSPPPPPPPPPPSPSPREE